VAATTGGVTGSTTPVSLPGSGNRAGLLSGDRGTRTPETLARVPSRAGGPPSAVGSRAGSGGGRTLAGTGLGLGLPAAALVLLLTALALSVRRTRRSSRVTSAGTRR